MATTQTDWAAEAAKFGGKPSGMEAAKTDWAAEAAKFGGKPATEGTLAFLNRGISRGLAFGIGSDSISAGMKALGIPVSERPAETIGEHMAEGAGIAAGSLPAMIYGAEAIAAKSGSAALASIAKTILGPFYKSPIIATGTDIAAGAGAGAGKGMVDESKHPILAPVAELVGGLAGGITFGASLEGRRLMLTTARDVVKTAHNRIVKSIFPFTESGARLRASKQLQSLVEKPLETAAKVGTTTIGKLSPAQATGEDNLMALERVIMEREPHTARIYAKQLQNSEEALKKAAEDMADIGGLESHIAAAADRANERLVSLTPSQQAEQASHVYHQELSDSLAAAKSVEKKLWDIPNVRVPTAESKRAFSALDADLPRAQSDDMPLKARILLSRYKSPKAEDALIVGPSGETVITKEAARESAAFNNSETVKEVHGFFSQMREDARLARAAGNWNRARIADKLADAAWLDLTGAADNPTEVGAQLKAAREYSSQLNQTFRQGDVGKILGYVKTGERRVQPSESLEIAFGGRGGAQAGVTADELTKAAQFGGRDPAKAETAIQDYLKRRFILAAHFDPANPGSFSLAGARTFLRNNEQLLGRFQTLLEDMNGAMNSMDISSKLGTARNTISKALRSQTPRDNLRKAMRGLPPEDLDAFRGALLEQGLYGLGRTSFDETGQAISSGAGLKGLLTSPKTRGAFEEVFGSTPTNRLMKIADELAAVQRAVSASYMEPEEANKIAEVLTFFGGTMGARLGAKLGKGTSGASLRIASKMAGLVESKLGNYMNKHSSKLLLDASTDPVLYKALLTPLDSPPVISSFALKTLTDWMKRTSVSSAKTVIIPAMTGTATTIAIGEQKSE